MRKEYFHDYEIFENGKIINKFGNEVKLREHKGRYETRLVVDGKRKNFLVARLLYFVFIGFDMSNKDLCITPKDGNHLNISLDNLDLVHRKDLIQGEGHKKRAKLTDEQIEEIKATYQGKMCVNQHDKTGISYQDLANKYGVTRANIKMIIKGMSRNKDEYKLK